MKMLLEERFLPGDYEQTLFEQYQASSQDKHSVQDYTIDFYRLMHRTQQLESVQSPTSNKIWVD